MISRHKPNEQATPLSVGFVLLNRFTLLPFVAFVDCLRMTAQSDKSCLANASSSWCCLRLNH